MEEINKMASKFTTAINCMDGRVQIPVNEYLKRRYGVDYIDTIIEPCPNRILAEKKDQATIDSIRRWLEISITKHGSKLVAIAGHHDCAGNPVGKKTQDRHTLAAIETVK